mmetsp:Transcript_398/g.440  ORF Transcript_398/g.440 Transcript_398/m.440 type:complete len:129 (-) Transcript_398:789-1175(-)
MLIRMSRNHSSDALNSIQDSERDPKQSSPNLLPQEMYLIGNAGNKGHLPKVSRNGIYFAQQNISVNSEAQYLPMDFNEAKSTHKSIANHSIMESEYQDENSYWRNTHQKHSKSIMSNPNHQSNLRFME